MNDELLDRLLVMAGELLELDPKRIDPDAPLIELGADSLILADAVRRIRQEFGVRIKIRELFEEISTLRQLAGCITEKRETTPSPVAPDDPSEEAADTPLAEVVAPAAAAPPGAALPAPPLPMSNGVAGVLANQLEVLTRTFQAQLDLLAGGDGGTEVAPTRSHDGAAVAPASKSASASEPPSAARRPEASPPVSGPRSAAYGFDSRQRAFLADFTRRFNEKTRGSKQAAQKHHRTLADRRRSIGIRLSPETKELAYPIVAQRSQGGRMWDVDGNEYVDFTMGFGTLLFGHRPDFLMQAIEEQLGRGVHVGPQAHLAGDVADLVCELTGHESVAFAAAGSEAVAMALRLARARRERTRFVFFGGSYHGINDTTLVLPEGGDDLLQCMPGGRGIPQSVADEAIVLPYGDPEALDVIRQVSGDIAAVMVEPVQSRSPDLQPREFLQELRKLTRETEVPLIFDEILTGFRPHPQGAQGFFGVEADLATYGKVVAGGLPVGLVAGRREFMDIIDGGAWQYGDDSVPLVATTPVGSTYSKHPLSMAAACAVMQKLRDESPEFQERLNRRAAGLRDALQEEFRAADAPIRMELFGSMGLLKIPAGLDVFRLLMIEKGIYLWERATCFVSSAHTDEDLDRIVDAARESLVELREGGFLEETRPSVAPRASEDSASGVLEVPLSDTQKQALVVETLHPDSCNESCLLRIRGEVDALALAGAFNELIARHQALRASVSADGDAFEVHPEVDGGLRLIDLGPEGGSEAAVRERAAELAKECFDIRRAPLVGAALLRHTPEDNWLQLRFHKLVVDGWSLGVIVHELFELYLARREGSEPDATPRLQLSEYAQWLENLEGTPEWREAEAHWLESLRGWESGFQLSHDADPKFSDALAGAQCSLRIDAETAARVRDVARRERATPFAVLLAAYMSLLHRLSGSDRVLVGSWAAVRDLEGAERLVGQTSNLIPCTSEIDPQTSFASKIRSLRDQVADGFEFSQYPFARMLRALASERSPDSPPLVSIAFNFDSHESLVSAGDVEIELVDLPARRSRLDLEVNVLDLGDGYRIDAEYSVSAFRPETIERWLDHFRVLLGSALDDIAAPIASLPLIAEPQRHEILRRGVGPPRARPRERSVAALVDEHARRNPAAAAIRRGDDELSYAHLARAVDALAGRLLECGVGPECLVGVAMERSLEMAVSLLALQKVGGAFLALDSAWPTARVEQVLSDAGVSLVLADEKIDLDPGALPLLRVTRDDVSAVGDAPPRPGVSASPGQLAYVLFTSGSTGRPKGVLIEQAGMMNHLFAKIEELQLGPDDRVLQTASVSFDIFVWQLLAPILAGGCVEIMEDCAARDPRLIAHTIERREITLAETVPALLTSAIDLLDEADAPSLASLRCLMVTGEALPPELCRRWLARRPEIPLVNAYGPTECSDDVTHHWVDAPPPENAVRTPVGRPIANVRVDVLDPMLAVTPPGVQGELCVRGVAVGRGYLNDPDRTDDRFVVRSGERLYRTGDLAMWDGSDASLHVTGRADDQIKVRGVRIELGEIEHALRTNPQVRDAAVRVWDGPAAKQLAAYVVPNGSQSADPEALRAYLQERLPMPMVPANFTMLDSLPLTPNGKVDRAALPQPMAEQPEAPAEFVPPTGQTEEAIAAIWREVLAVEQVGAEDAFFSLGGDSILALQVVTRARRAGLFFSLLDIMERPTVRALAEHLTPAAESKRNPLPVSALQRELLASGHGRASWLDLPEDCSPERVRDAWTSVLSRHEGLRVRFERDGAEDWRAELSAPEEVAFHVVDPAVQSAGCSDEELTEEALGRIRPGSALLALFVEDTPDPRLLLAAHDALVDGPSWVLLMEEVSAAIAGRTLRESPPIGALARRLPEGAAHGPIADAATASFERHRQVLPGSIAEVLRDQGLFSHRAELPELCVAALANALADGQARTLRVDLEARPGELASLERGETCAIGCLTYVRANVLELAAVDDLDGALRQALDAIDAPNPAVSGPARANARIRLAGEFPDRFGTNGSTVRLLGAPQRPADAVRVRAPLEVEVGVVGDALIVDWIHCKNSEFGMELHILCDRFARALECLAESCREPLARIDEILAARAAA